MDEGNIEDVLPIEQEYLVQHRIIGYDLFHIYKRIVSNWLAIDFIMDKSVSDQAYSFEQKFRFKNIVDYFENNP